jgi:hypothetical protein
MCAVELSTRSTKRLYWAKMALALGWKSLFVIRCKSVHFINHVKPPHKARVSSSYKSGTCLRYKIKEYEELIIPHKSIYICVQHKATAHNKSRDKLTDKVLIKKLNNKNYKPQCPK